MLGINIVHKYRHVLNFAVRISWVNFKRSDFMICLSDLDGLVFCSSSNPVTFAQKQAAPGRFDNTDNISLQQTLV